MMGWVEEKDRTEKRADDALVWVCTVVGVLALIAAWLMGA